MGNGKKARLARIQGRTTGKKTFEGYPIKPGQKLVAHRQFW
jgi:hypothetical protein